MSIIHKLAITALLTSTLAALQHDQFPSLETCPGPLYIYKAPLRNCEYVDLDREWKYEIYLHTNYTLAQLGVALDITDVDKYSRGGLKLDCEPIVMHYFNPISPQLREKVRTFEGVKWVNCDRECSGGCLEAGEEDRGFLNRGCGPFCHRLHEGAKCDWTCDDPPHHIDTSHCHFS